MSGAILAIVAIVAIVGIVLYAYSQSFWAGSEFKKRFDVALASESVETVRECNQLLAVEERQVVRKGVMSSKFEYYLSSRLSDPAATRDGSLVIEESGGTLDMVRIRFDFAGRPGYCAVNAGIDAVVATAMPGWFYDDPGCVISEENSAFQNWASCRMDVTRMDSQSIEFRGHRLTMTADPAKFVDVEIVRI